MIINIFQLIKNGSEAVETNTKEVKNKICTCKPMDHEETVARKARTIFVYM